MLPNQGFIHRYNIDQRYANQERGGTNRSVVDNAGIHVL